MVEKKLLKMKIKIIVFCLFVVKFSCLGQEVYTVKIPQNTPLNVDSINHILTENEIPLAWGFDEKDSMYYCVYGGKTFYSHTTGQYLLEISKIKIKSVVYYRWVIKVHFCEWEGTYLENCNFLEMCHIIKENPFRSCYSHLYISEPYDFIEKSINLRNYCKGSIKIRYKTTKKIEKIYLKCCFTLRNPLN